MSKELLTKEEIEELLTSPPASAEPDGVPDLLAAEDRADYSEIILRYWQQTVVQMQRELAELRLRVETLEKQPAAKTKGNSAGKNKTLAEKQQGSNGKPELKADSTLSRKEKFKSSRGKWF